MPRNHLLDKLFLESKNAGGPTNIWGSNAKVVCDFLYKKDFGRDFTEKRLDFNKVKSFEFRSRKSTESTNLSV